MITEHLLAAMISPRTRGLVLAAGGSADLILAKALAKDLVSRGCVCIDLAQPLNCKRLSDKRFLDDASNPYALSREDGLDPDAVLRHHAYVPPSSHSPLRRGKGICISSSLEWSHGTRYVCAGRGDGPSVLARRQEGGRPYYDFAIAVDGGGDVLTHDEPEFDCVVLANFRSGWPVDHPLMLVSLGLGADGGSPPAAFDRHAPLGWRLVARAEADSALADSLQMELERLNLWHHSPASWASDDPEWGYGFKVPQIIALAVRGEFPFGTSSEDPGVVLYPRRHELRPMLTHLLREARVLLSEACQ